MPILSEILWYIWISGKQWVYEKWGKDLSCIKITLFPQDTGFGHGYTVDKKKKKKITELITSGAYSAEVHSVQSE